MNAPARRFSTGLRFLDQRIDGGIPIGTILALTAPASAQSELLLREFTTAHPCLYVSTTCADPAELAEVLDESPDSEYTCEYVPPESLLEGPTTVLSEITPESFVVIDDVTRLERGGRATYLDFLNQLKARLRVTDSIALLHCLETADTPPLRGLTLKRSDHVWQLKTSLDPNDIRNQIYITKSRGYRALSEPIPLVLTDQVQIDTTRNI